MSIKTTSPSFRVGIDKLTAVIHWLPDADGIESNIKQIIAMLCSVHEVSPFQICTRQNGYAYSIVLPLSKKLDLKNKYNNQGLPKLIVQVKPNAHTRPFIRFELTGFPLLRGDYFIARRWLESIIGRMATLYLHPNKVKVTRIDIAHDFKMHMDEINVNFTHAMKSACFFGKDGKPETLYFAIDSVQKKLIVYSLKAKRKRDGKPDIDEYDTRAELRLQPKCFLSELPEKVTAHSYIDRIEFFDLSLFEDEKISTLEKNYIALFGIKAALQAMDKNHRRSFRLKLAKHKVQYFDHDLIDKELKKEFKRMRGLFSDYDCSHIANHVQHKFDAIFQSYHVKSDKDFTVS
ncbi:hypothetical protein [Rheinheimera metallidurans]|uniref:hypothetical protein n=1 Tax=Rheinheimera metallidurans TaxID=2925781 RepID=UPI003001D39C